MCKIIEKPSFRGWIFCVAACGKFAFAAEPQVVETEKPLQEGSSHWRKPPAHSRWEIEFQNQSPSAGRVPSTGPAYRPVKVTVTRHGKELLEEVLMEDGKRWETWTLGTVQIQSQDGNNNVWLRPAQAKSNGGTESADYHSFGEFQWIRREHFRGTFPAHGRQAHVYLYPLGQSSPEMLQKLGLSKKGPLAGLPLCEGILAAAIHPETRYPLMLQQGAQVRTYSFATLPTGPLALPEKVTRFRQLLTAPARVVPRPLP